jgi:hypothetical protein
VSGRAFAVAARLGHGGASDVAPSIRNFSRRERRRALDAQFSRR